MKTKEITFQRECDNFVQQEVIYNVSCLIRELDRHDPEFRDEFPDIFIGPLSIGLWTCPQCECEGEREPHQDQCPKCKCIAALAHDFEPTDYREVFEHWIVSDRLADKLEAAGEAIERDLYGLVVWSRTTAGQAISRDHVIQKIYKETK